ncbi:unnamed protein product [Darwinula stevensoni]|uniref:Protein kinase domain-containing protein n=1 Tax=Darwinula stevensoni TaxID=69355 RepID=A0A7R9AHR6_9CRUS|nr:unnamed protein product [Darwinula stevensoni]CAG0905625.1 unnamed protein product [Darwinula stevensoni]
MQILLCCYLGITKAASLNGYPIGNLQWIQERTSNRPSNGHVQGLSLNKTFSPSSGCPRRKYVTMKVVHRDLAARNILLGEENIVKICDFGLARDIYRDNQYVMEGVGPLPIKWMALESLTENMVSTPQSDVWAYGITLWEMFSLGMTPYPGMSGQELVERLKDGYRLDAPQYAKDNIYQIMRKCWRAYPSNRPTFSTLSAWFGEMLSESELQHYLEMNKPYEERNIEYFRTKTDYLRMIPVKPDDGYVRPLRSRDAGVEKYDVTASHTYVNSEISQPKVHYLPMTSTKLQADLQETMEPQIQEEIPIANSNIIVGPIIRSEQYRSTGSEPRLEIRLTSTDEDHRLDHEEGLDHEETPLDNLANDLELIAPEVPCTHL